MKPLQLSAGSELLFHASPGRQVDVWRLSDGEYLCSCPGNLVGISRDNQFLLTSTPAGPKAWSIPAGLETEPAVLSPDQFEFHQRFYMIANRYQLELELRDALGREQPQTVTIEHDPRYQPGLDVWELAPDNSALVATMSGEVAGADWSSGLCIDLEMGLRRFKFKVNKYQSLLPLNFSREHRYLLVSADMYHLAVIDLASGTLLKEVWLNGFANVASALPASTQLMAVNVWETAAGMRNSPFSIQILNLEQMSGARMLRPKVEAVFSEPEAVVDLVCAPDGMHVASLLASGTIHWWNMISGRVERVLDVEAQKSGARA